MGSTVSHLEQMLHDVARLQLDVGVADGFVEAGELKKTNLVHFPTFFQVFIYTCSIRANASGSVRCFAKPNASPSPILDGALRDHPVPRASSARFKRLHSLRFPKYVFF